MAHAVHTVVAASPFFGMAALVLDSSLPQKATI